MSGPHGQDSARPRLGRECLTQFAGRLVCKPPIGKRAPPTSELGSRATASHFLGGSSNGRTADSGSVYQGSNPCPPATLRHHSRRTPRPHRLAVRTSPSHGGNVGSIPTGVAESDVRIAGNPSGLPALLLWDFGRDERSSHGVAHRLAAGLALACAGVGVSRGRHRHREVTRLVPSLPSGGFAPRQPAVTLGRPSPLLAQQLLERSRPVRCGRPQ